jgi:hypothetical protein
MARRRKYPTSYQPLGVLVGLCRGSVDKASSHCKFNAQRLDEFGFGRLVSAQARRLMLSGVPSTHTHTQHHSPSLSLVFLSLLLSMLPSMFLAAPVALSLLLPLSSAATSGRRATTCNGFSDVCAQTEIHNRELIFGFVVVREKLWKCHFCWCA